MTNPRIEASRRLADAMEYGDANEAAQILLAFPETHPEGLGRGHIYAMAEMGVAIKPRTGFWSDVAALIRLETQSDETSEQETERLYDEAKASNTPAAWASFEAARERHSL